MQDDSPQKLLTLEELKQEHARRFALYHAAATVLLALRQIPIGRN